MERVLTDDGSWTLRDPRTGETFRSRGGALAEARRVYLELSGAADRAREGRPTRVLEVGFGGGLNFLVTWDAFATSGTPLRYDALEDALPSCSALASLEYGACFGDGRFEALLERLGDSAASSVLELDADTTLRLMRADARSVALASDAYDVVYLDPFSPAVAPELWEPAFLARLAGSLRPGGVLTSYCVRGSVRRDLRAAGLDVEKQPGPGRKREVLRARRPR